MDTPGFGLSLLGLLGVVALVATNAFFVATEFALVAVRRTQVEVWVAEGRRGARAIQTAIEHLDARSRRRSSISMTQSRPPNSESRSPVSGWGGSVSQRWPG